MNRFESLQIYTTADSTLISLLKKKL